jgi:hypothetical protein
MSLKKFLNKIKNNGQVSFDETLLIISENYDYAPTEFSSGLGDSKLINVAGSNEGSCKIFSFAQINLLNQQQTLNLFGDFYSKEVLQSPLGSGHHNIRNFIKYGWKGIDFTNQALSPNKSKSD